jgi:hypothetical protein
VSAAITLNLTAMNFGAAVTGLASCICTAFQEAGIGLCSCCASIGPVVGECDCDCASSGTAGQLRISPGVMGPSRTFPQILTADNAYDRACPPPYVVLPLNIEIMRCVPSISSAGTPLDGCTPDGIASTLAWFTDAAAVRQAVACCLDAMRLPGASPSIARWSLGTTAPIVPSGGCAGSLTVAYIGLANFGCC